MIPVLLRAGARYHLRHRWQLALALLGVALGVAVVVAVDVATASARRAFDLSTEAVSGRATHEIFGGPAGVADSTYVRLRMTAPDAAAIAPVVDRYVRLPDHDGRVLRLLGADPFAEAPFRDFVAAGDASFDMGVLITTRSLVIARSTADALGIQAGDSLHVAFGASITPAVVAGIFDPHDEAGRLALADVALADIATAQELTGSIGTIDRIEVRATGEDAAEAVAALRASLPAGLRMIESEARAGATARLTRAFDTNLTALALVALVFGMFLIYNSVSFSVVQRRPLFGLLRAQGVTTRELFMQIIVEAAVLGAVATLLGLAGGSALGAMLVRLVARTINDLYFSVSVSSVHLAPLTFAKAALLGLGATVAAAVPPALEALRTPPRASLARAALERKASHRAPRLAIGGFAAAAVAALLFLLPSRSIIVGFTGLFVLVLAGALLTPAATILFMRAVRPIASRFGAVGRMSPGGVTSSLSRTAPAIAALAVALSVGIAVTLMIVSFRSGVVRWLEQSLQADIYIAAPDIRAGGNVTLAPRLPEAILALAEVEGVSTYRELSLLLPSPDAVRAGGGATSTDPVRPDGRAISADPVRSGGGAISPDPVRAGGGATSSDLVRMFAFDPFQQHRDAFELLDTDPGTAWRAFDRGAVLISEPLAYRRSLGAGDTLVLPTGRGAAAFAVAGVYRDYASEHGVIFMPRQAYDIWWEDRGVTSLGVFLGEGADATEVLATIRQLPAARGVLARQNRGLREATLEVFDRTFLITGVLRLLALIVAFVGVTGALMALQLERSRDIGVLRALGLTPLQVWSLVTSQTALMGLSAAALAVPLGIAMSWAMVHVINRRSFGWSFDLVLTGAPFAQALGVGIAAAVLAGIYPALRMARLRPARALRDE
ncbi:MAG TPA: ABC transporter permease [Longimicrobiales bacterium]|nr:ABC transporter permease [Longimicrobiales bacterium]